MIATRSGMIHGGPFVRMAANRVKEEAWARGLEYRDERMGIINQTVQWTVRGDTAKVERFAADVSRFIAKAGS